MENSTLQLPGVLEALILSQNDQDSSAFTACFYEHGEVYDEGEHHKGWTAIKAWNELTSAKYNTHSEPIAFIKSDTEDVLTVKVSGNFAGSPIVLDYHLQIENDLIIRLSIQ